MTFPSDALSSNGHQIANYYESVGDHKSAESMRKTAEDVKKIQTHQWLAIAAGTAFILNNVAFIVCGANKCYSKASSSDSWCKSYCLDSSQTTMIAVEVISGLVCAIMCIVACRGK